MEILKICIIETAPIPENPIDAHVRNAIEIQRYLRSKGHECDLVAQNQKIVVKKYDILIVSYASLYFDFKTFGPLFEANKEAKVGWLTNEYNLSPNSFYKKMVSFVIANFEEKKWKKKWYSDFLMVNLNTFFAREPNKETRKLYDAIYYGTFRPGRDRYFKKYLKKDFILSTSEKNKRKFKEIGATCRYMGKMNWLKGKETLNQFKASLYIEDEVTHDLYNHLANRFYEALFCNCGIFFDKSCQNTIKRSGYPIDSWWIVESYDEMMQKVKDPSYNERRLQFVEDNTKHALAERSEAFARIEQFLHEVKNGKSI